MRWEDERESSNVEDVRGDSGGGGGFGGGGGGGGLGALLMLLPLLGRGGIGGIAILVIIGLVVFGGPLLGGRGNAPPQRAPSGYQGQSYAPGAGASGADPQAADLGFVKRVAAFTEDTWGQVFQEQGRTYTPAKFKIYRNAYPTACGQGQSAMGPFYCPGDRTVYLDLSFFQELSQRFGAPGRFAEAYVVAHEVGHHIQNLTGEMDRGSGSGETRNQTSVRTELQADCYAGVWAMRTDRARQSAGKVFLEAGDLEQGLKAASAVGDDTLQRESRGRVVPDSFTHGSSDQRTRWLRTGFQSGDLASCNTWDPPYGQL